jgi:hypothetical protein
MMADPVHEPVSEGNECILKLFSTWRIWRLIHLPGCFFRRL